HILTCRLFNFAFTMATTFYDFSRLPKGLRHMIWEWALRPNIPGVHFFRMNDMTTLPAEGAVVRDYLYINESLNITQKEPGMVEGRFDASRKKDPIERELVTFQAGNHRFVEVKYDKEDNYT
ncbi:hypothetical protein KAF25_003789, partial [Fusarium avenaceum]